MIALRSVRRAAEVRQFVKFLIVGGINTLVGYSLFAAFLMSGMASGFALITAAVLGTIFNFASTGRVVFKSSTAVLLPRFVIFYAGQCIVNLALLQTLENIGIPSLVAQAILVPFIAVLTFFGLRQFVFTGGRS
jgi:putative flippase GtrA